MAVYGLRLTSGRGRSNWIFNGTILMSLNATGVSFFNVAPVARAGAYTQTYATADKTHAAMTSAAMPAGGVGAAAGGWDTAANRDTAITEFANLRNDVIDAKQLINSVIDDLQAYGLLQ